MFDDVTNLLKTSFLCKLKYIIYCFTAFYVIACPQIVILIAIIAVREDGTLMSSRYLMTIISWMSRILGHTDLDTFFL